MIAPATERPGRVFWITGLSGAGKSTLARALYEALRAAGVRPVLLDGDAIRELLLEPAGHDRAARLNIARFNGRLCRLVASQGIDVICPTISLFHECQRWNRANIARYVEILLDVPLNVVAERDAKGIYARARAGQEKNVVGLDIVAETPESPDIVFSHAEPLTADEMAGRVLLLAPKDERAR